MTAPRVAAKPMSADGPLFPEGRWRGVPRSVWIGGALWLLATAAVFGLAGDRLPFDRPLVAGTSVTGEVINSWISLIVALGLIGVTYFLTRRRPIPDIMARTPTLAQARLEVGSLMAYGVLGQLGGIGLGNAFSGHPISLNMHGSIYGASHPLTPSEAVLWAAYNFIVYAVIPYIWFRQRGYSNEQLGLRSSNRRHDVLVIAVILTIETIIELTFLGGAFFALDGNQMLSGVPLSFALNLIGTGLPIMVFIYAILLPRILRLTGSVATTVILGGVAYASVHAFEGWAIYASIPNLVLSVIFLAFQYVGPGVVKSALTLRTGYAWVHLWAYHAFAPHAILDAPTLVNIFRIR